MNVDDRLQVQDLISLYAYYIDSLKVSEWVALFAPDGVLDESEFGMGRHAGHDALRAYGQGISERVLHLIHLMSNVLIWESNDQMAKATSFAIVESMQKTGARARYHVKYEDDLRRLDGRWVIHERILRKSFPPEKIS